MKWGGAPDEEKFEHPFDNTNNDYRYIYQDMSNEEQKNILSKL